MPDEKISVGLVVVFFIITVLAGVYDLPYCSYVSLFLCLLFSTPLEESFIQEARVKLGIEKADQSAKCISRKQYLLLYVTSAVIGSILNIMGVLFSIPGYVLFGIDIVIIAICSVMHRKMQYSPREEEMSEFDKMYNNHPLAQREKARYNSLSSEKKEKLKFFEEQDPEEYQLNKIKIKRIKPQKGNVFVVSPKENMYFFGVVINAGINIPEGDDMCVIFILKDMLKSPDDIYIPEDITNLLIQPCIVGRWYWNKGFFYNTGIDVEIPDDLDYGFYSVVDRRYEDEYGNPLGKEPELVGIAGACTWMGVAYHINYELICNGMI